LPGPTGDKANVISIIKEPTKVWAAAGNSQWQRNILLLGQRPESPKCICLPFVCSRWRHVACPLLGAISEEPLDTLIVTNISKSCLKEHNFYLHSHQPRGKQRVSIPYLNKMHIFDKKTSILSFLRTKPVPGRFGDQGRFPVVSDYTRFTTSFAALEFCFVRSPSPYHVRPLCRVQVELASVGTLQAKLKMLSYPARVMLPGSESRSRTYWCTSMTKFYQQTLR
jgi:hypothetical protein